MPITTLIIIIILSFLSLLLSAATSMKWIEVKMKELGVSSNPDYKLTFMVDSSACISVQTPKYGMVDVSKLTRWESLEHQVAADPPCHFPLFNVVLSIHASLRTLNFTR